MTERLLLLSGPWLKSLVLFRALLALEVHCLLGEANLFPRFSCGSFMVSPSGKCLLHTLWKSLRSSTRSSTSSHRPRLGFFVELYVRTHSCLCTLCNRTRYIDVEAFQDKDARYPIHSGSQGTQVFHCIRVYGNTGPYTAAVSYCFLY